jgi:hypothetical protein
MGTMSAGQLFEVGSRVTLRWDTFGSESISSGRQAIHDETNTVTVTVTKNLPGGDDLGGLGRYDLALRADTATDRQRLLEILERQYVNLDRYPSPGARFEVRDRVPDAHSGIPGRCDDVGVLLIEI